MNVTKAKLFLLLVKAAAIFIGLSAGLSLCHVLEVPGKHTLTGLEFAHVQQTFYGGFAIFGAVSWIYGITAGLIEGFAFHKTNKSIAVYSFMASASLSVCLIIYYFFLKKYNLQISSWRNSLSPDWQAIRNNWELCHVIVFIFSTISFLFFLNSYGLYPKPAHEKNLNVNSFQ
jgi:hypothetical protein